MTFPIFCARSPKTPRGKLDRVRLRSVALHLYLSVMTEAGRPAPVLLGERLEHPQRRPEPLDVRVQPGELHADQRLKTREHKNVWVQAIPGRSRPFSLPGTGCGGSGRPSPQRSARGTRGPRSTPAGSTRTRSDTVTVPGTAPRLLKQMSPILNAHVDDETEKPVNLYLWARSEARRPAAEAGRFRHPEGRASPGLDWSS
jgi:hypothetical protein